MSAWLPCRCDLGVLLRSTNDGFLLCDFHFCHRVGSRCGVDVGHVLHFVVGPEHRREGAEGRSSALDFLRGTSHHRQVAMVGGQCVRIKVLMRYATTGCLRKSMLVNLRTLEMLAWTWAENFSAAAAPMVFRNSERDALRDLDRIDFLRVHARAMRVSFGVCRTEVVTTNKQRTLFAQFPMFPRQRQTEGFQFVMQGTRQDARCCLSTVVQVRTPF